MSIVHFLSPDNQHSFKASTITLLITFGTFYPLTKQNVTTTHVLVSLSATLVTVQCTPWFGLAWFVSDQQSVSVLSAWQDNPTQVNAKFKGKTRTYIVVNLAFQTTATSQFTQLECTIKELGKTRKYIPRKYNIALVKISAGLTKCM